MGEYAKAEGKEKRRNGWGGARLGAGRPRAGWRREGSHAKRPEFTGLQVLHVTMRLAPGLPSLRNWPTVIRLEETIRAAQKTCFTIAAYSIQRNHVHLIVEADGREAWIMGTKGLATRMARALNRQWRRRGPVFACRYHGRLVRGKRHMRQTLRYVLLNHRKHDRRLLGVDPASSGPWFEGWFEPEAVPARYRARPCPVAPPRSRLLRAGWREGGGPIDLRELPGGFWR